MSGIDHSGRPEPPKPGTVCIAHGYRFVWTEEHIPGSRLHPLLFTYDRLADECLDRLDELCPPGDAVSTKGCPSGAGGKRDLFALVRDNAHRDDKLGELWTQVTTVPAWVDWEQIRRGQDVFHRYAGPSIVAVSLVIHSSNPGKDLWRMFLGAYPPAHSSRSSP